MGASPVRFEALGAGEAVIEVEGSGGVGERGEWQSGGGVGVVSRVVRCAARAPLRVLTPDNHGRAVWICLSSFGGGLVDGDALRVRLRVGAGAAAHLSTQASTKVYPGSSSQSLDVDVGEGGLLSVLPDPVVCFGGARYRQSQNVRLSRGASLVWLDALGAGRVEHGERWAFERYESRTRVERDGRPFFVDAVCLDVAHGDLGRRMRRFSATATLLAVGPGTEVLRALWMETGPLSRGAGAITAPSPLGEDAVVVRVAAVSMRELSAVLARLLAPIGGLLGDDPLSRKW